MNVRADALRNPHKIECWPRRGKTNRGITNRCNVGSSSRKLRHGIMVSLDKGVSHYTREVHTHCMKCLAVNAASTIRPSGSKMQRDNHACCLHDVSSLWFQLRLITSMPSLTQQTNNDNAPTRSSDRIFYIQHYRCVTDPLFNSGPARRNILKSHR